MSRPNAEMALKYWADPTMKVWFWHAGAWRLAERTPSFSQDAHWHVGHEAPTDPPQKMCELAGVKFPMPMREAPKLHTAYWWVSAYGAAPDRWVDHEADRSRLAAGLCQATEAGAIAQAKAMQAALQQAIERAK